MNSVVSSLIFGLAKTGVADGCEQPAVGTVDFDASNKASTAWTARASGQVQSGGNSPDTECHGGDDEAAADVGEYPARALYAFEGKPEFRELSLKGGEAIVVLREDVGGGWSLVARQDGELGLVPQAYYTVSRARANHSAIAMIAFARAV